MRVTPKNKNPWDERNDAITFSIGVFQWLPKTGEGLEKSKSIPINGYVCEAKKAYAVGHEWKMNPRLMV